MMFFSTVKYTPLYHHLLSVTALMNSEKEKEKERRIPIPTERKSEFLQFSYPEQQLYLHGMEYYYKKRNALNSLLAVPVFVIELHGTS